MHKTQREYMHQKKKKILAFDTNGCVTKIQSVTEFENHTQNATSIHVQKKNACNDTNRFAAKNRSITKSENEKSKKCVILTMR